MLNFLKRLFMFSDDKVKGEVVYGKLKDQVHPCYIPYSKNSGDKPVIATEQFAVPKTGYNLSDTLRLNKVSDKAKVQISMANSGQGNKTAPMDLGSASQYLLIGGREYNVGSYRGIGMGYIGNPNEIAPVFVGMEEVGADKATNGNFVVATRSKTDNVAPTVNFKVDINGQVLANQSYMPKFDYALATKKYVDDAVKSGGKGGSVYASNVSCPAMSPSGTSTNVEGILRELNARIYNIEKQMPH